MGYLLYLELSTRLITFQDNPDNLFANRVSHIADDQNVHIQKKHPLFYL